MVYHYAHHRARLFVRAAATTFLCVALVLDIVAVGVCERSISGEYSDYGLGCTSIAGFSGISAALLYNAIEFVTMWKNGKGLHPGAHIAVDLCLVAWLATSSTFDIAFSSSYFSNKNDPMLVAGVFEVVAALLHLTLFVLACIAVHKWRREPERVVRVLEKMKGKRVDNVPLYLGGGVRVVPLNGKKCLVYYIQEGDGGDEGAPAYVEYEGGRDVDGCVKGEDLELRGL